MCAACASTRTQRTRVLIEDIPATDSWRAALTFAQPVSEIDWVRPATFRAERWKADRGRWLDGKLVFDRPTRKVVFEFPTDTRDLIKDYTPNLAFTEGSRLLYNGHFRAGDWPHEWTFRSPRTMRTILDPTKDDDTYVYFGSIPPVETDRMTLIVDPGLPPWIAAQMRDRAPKLMDYYARILGRELGFKPLVLLSYGGDATSGFSFKGGTLPGLVQLAVQGKGWTTQSDEGTELWFFHLAHELFHITGHPAEDAEWLSEGMADHAAFLALRDLGVIDEARRKRHLVEWANECIVKLEGKPLRQANPRNFYTCGTVLLERLGPASYRGLRDYTTADFLANLSPADSAIVTQLLERGPGVPTDVFIADQLRAAGIDVTRVDPPVATATHNALQPMLVETIRRCACRTSVADACSRPFAHQRINGIDSRRKPAEGWTSLLSTADSKLTLGDKDYALRCGAEDRDGSWETLVRLEPETTER